MSEKFETCKVIFDALGSDINHLSTALSASNRDSQVEVLSVVIGWSLLTVNCTTASSE